MKRPSWHWFACALAALSGAQSAQGHGKAAPVPPSLEMVLLDPSADPLGNPAVQPRMSATGAMVIDVPPTVIVHRYYYAGDRTFQGPFVPGGPTIVVASHPKTGERLYIPVQMIPGSARVTYTHRSIEYDYGNQGIDIEFCLTGRPTVSYRRGKTFHRIATDICRSAAEASKKLALRSGAAEVSQKSIDCVKSVSGAAVDRVHDAGKLVAQPFLQLKQYIPGINMLTTSPEDAAQRARDVEIRLNADRNFSKGIDIPTLR